MRRDIHLRATFSVHLPLGPVVSQYSGCATLVAFRVKYNNITIHYTYYCTLDIPYILLYLKTTYLLSLIFFFLFSFFWIITCYFFFLPLFFLIVVCWFSFFSFYQEWTTSFCLKCFGIWQIRSEIGPIMELSYFGII